MTQLNQKDLRTPFNAQAIRLLRGRMEKLVSKQGAAANLTEVEVLDIRGKLQEIAFIGAAVPAAGESLTIDVQKNGVTVLDAPFVFDDTLLGATLYKLAFVDDTTFDLGDTLTVIRTYVAGGGPTPIGANKLITEIA